MTSHITVKAALSKRNVAAALRRDATFIWNVVICVVFAGFAGLAIAAALFDLLPIRH